MRGLRQTGLCALLLVLACAPQAREAPPADADASVVVAFSPQTGAGSAEALVLETVSLARESIRVAIYVMTSRRVVDALADAHARGIEVRIVADAKTESGPRSALTRAVAAGIPVRLNARYANMHHKFMVIDGRHVQTGSYNYTQYAATRNAENVLLLRDMPAIAATYAAEWQRLWEESEPVAATGDGAGAATAR